MYLFQLFRGGRPGFCPPRLTPLVWLSRVCSGTRGADGVVVVTGRAAYGKTFLVRGMSLEAETQGFRVFRLPLPVSGPLPLRVLLVIQEYLPAMAAEIEALLGDNRAFNLVIVAQQWAVLTPAIQAAATTHIHFAVPRVPTIRRLP
jgi:hypothetical protein